ncbi:MAG: hypothetical protein PWP65_880 [Clostridia bacterium]|nr:hypothetical protein [Clostridia bacterium]
MRLALNCSYLPPEIPYALGLEPFRPWGAGEDLAGGEAYLPRDYCPYAKALVGSFSSQNMKESRKNCIGLAAALCCDPMRRAADVVNFYRLAPRVFPVEVPRLTGSTEIAYFRTQLASWQAELACALGVELDQEALRRSIWEYNAWRRLCKRLSFSGSSWLDLLTATSLLPEKPSFPDREIGGAFSDTRPRLLLGSTCLLDAGLVELIESCGARVVGVDSCFGERTWNFEVAEDGDPLTALAASYLRRPPCPRSQNIPERRAWLQNLLEGRRAEGLIWFIPKFCDHALYEAAWLRQNMAGWPLLVIEGEYGAGRQGQVRTRVEAFIEQLEWFREQAGRKSRDRQGNKRAPVSWPARKKAVRIFPGRQAADLSSPALRTALRTGPFYAAAGTLVKWRKPKWACRHERSGVALALELTRQAYQRRRPVIWASVYVPTELIYGLGGVPFMPEVAAAFGASLKRAPAMLAAAESAWYLSDLCSFHRCACGMALKGFLPRPDAVLASESLCDGAKRFLQQLAERYGAPFYLLEVPYEESEGTYKQLAARLEGVARNLIDRSKGRLKLDGLPEAIELSNRARAAYLEACRWRRAAPAPWSGSRALNYLAFFFLAFGSPRLVDFYEDLAADLAERVEAGYAAVPGEKYRLLWLHMRPYYGSELFNFLEGEKKAALAFEEYNYLYWPELDPNRPFLSLARKMLAHPGWGPVERRLASILEMCRTYRVEGVVHFGQWGCRQTNGGVRVIKDGLAAADIPFLNLDGDSIDSRNFLAEQARTRLEAFLELIDFKRGK